MTARFDLGTKPHLGYTGSVVERAAELRRDPAAIALLEADARARAFVIGGERVVMRKGEPYSDPTFTLAAAETVSPKQELVFLGRHDGAPLFGIAIDPDAAEALKGRNDLLVTDLRSIATGALVAPEHLPPLAAAKALLAWHRRHRFCSNCGAPTRLTQAGWRRDCAACGAEHFPRTDPVVIMLAIHGERCLLGRQSRFAKGMWSCLAGFVEPGETIEDAVRRETLEEAGIVCGRVAYFASQPWPFPMSLMIGCHAQALTTELKVDRSELEDARWFERDEVAAMMLRRHPDGLTATHPFAIAHHIIRAWLEVDRNLV
ncbi:MAG TPA: NAD(+) diphosphatase [Xanthobacteraceae bacterium]|jgi:NAD+ diphosphatase|nr:NAD(+) diphosphatase [Xanthobacteraceae bacterium]